MIWVLSVNNGSCLLESFDRDQTAEMRVYYLQSAWNAFLGSPLLGAYVEDPSLGHYPHNIFFEAFQALGLLGGLLLILIVLYSLGSAYRVIRGAYGWIALVYILFLVASVFSGSLWGGDVFWVSLGLLLGVDAAQGVSKPLFGQVGMQIAIAQPTRLTG